MRDILKLALEDDTSGKAGNEIEHVIYARLENMSLLKTASGVERQEQWNICVDKNELNAGSGGVRVRKTVVGDEEPVYVLTTKVRKGDNSKIETSVPTSVDMFESFKFLADDGLIKDRHHFPVQGTTLVWEVDMFLKPDGTYYEWCKIDLEVNSLDDPIPELPIEFAEVIMPKGYGRQDEEKSKALIEKLYDQFFRSPNEYRLRAEQK